MLYESGKGKDKITKFKNKTNKVLIKAQFYEKSYQYKILFVLFYLLLLIQVPYPEQYSSCEKLICFYLDRLWICLICLFYLTPVLYQIQLKIIGDVTQKGSGSK